MRRLRHLAPFLVLLSAALVASLSATSVNEDDSIDKMGLDSLRESRNFSSLLIDGDLSMNPSSQISKFFDQPVSSLRSIMSCDFTLKSCQWDGIDSINKWNWVKPSYNQMKKDGPVYDYNDSSAYSLQVNFTLIGTNIYILTSPQFTVTGVSCFTFGYYFLVDASKQNKLSVILSGVGQSFSTAIWSTAGVNIDSWQIGQTQIDKAGTYKIKLIASGSAGFISVRRFTLSSGACQTSVCNFENGQCGFTTGGSSSNAFSLTSGLYTVGTFRNDHTSHSPYGHMMYANMAHQGDTTTLTSAPMANLQNQCLRFFFLRGGSGVRLRLLKFHTSSGRTDPTVWQSNETHLVNEWIRVQQNLLITDQVKLIFEATKLDSTSSKVEIDDVSLTPFQCSPPITCEFNEDFCGWKEETTTSTLLWSLGIGRVNDPTKLKTQTPINIYRSVLYTDFTQMQTGQGSMELMSEFVDMPLLGGACVSFSYRVLSISLDTDSFQLNQIDVSGNRNVLWSFSDTTKIGYGSFITHKVYVPKTVHSVPFRLSLSAKSASASTYLGVRYFYYTTDLRYCDHGGATTKPTTTTTTTVSPAKTLNCDFDKGNLCNWKSILFKVTSPYSTNIKSMFFPMFDHTTTSRYGKVAYSYSESRNYPIIGRMTADNPYPNTRLCFSFYYYFYSGGPSSFALTMDKLDSSGTDREVPVFRGFGGNEDVWRKAIFTIIPNDTYSSFTFRAALQDGVLVLDDILVRQGECYPFQLGNGDRTCDFEQNQTCIFEPIFSGYPTWKVYTASTFGIVDHTTHTSDGHYYGLDLSVFGSRSPGTTLKRSTVLSRTLNGYNYRCLQFSYMLANVLPNTTLYYDIKYRGGLRMENIHWEVAGSTLKMWFNKWVALPYIRTFDLQLGIATLGEPAGKVFVDDIKFLTTSCSSPHYCDFENGDICNMNMILETRNRLSSSQGAFMARTKNGTAITDIYLTDYADQIWHVFTPRQSSSFVQFDNTYRTLYGHYLLLTAEYPSDRGIMVTERYNLAENSGRICFSFAVYKPTTQSVLEVYQSESFNETHGTKIWDITRTTNSWETFEILAYPFQKSSTDIFFYLVGTLNDKNTYLGLDDVRLKSFCSNPSNQLPTTTLSPGMTTSTPDPNLYFICHNGNRISANLACNYRDDCGDNSDELRKNCGSCDFSGHTWCRYSQMQYSGDFAFRFRDTVNVGPRYGSDDNGNFLVASGHYGSTYLYTPVLHQSYLLCSFSFYYYYSSNEPANNDSRTAMKLYIDRTDLSSSTRVLLWESSFARQPNATWRSVTVPVRRVHHPFKLTFHAYQSSSTPNKVHAIDDVSMSSCQPPRAYSGSCSSSYYRCANNVCVLKSYVCDFEDDCGDGSDEQNCPVNSVTSFETGLGFWGKGMNRNWRIYHASSFDSLRDGPTFDHSTELYGHYLYSYAETYGSSNVSKTAEIDSPAFTANSGCQIRYYVFKNSLDSNLLAMLENVYTGQRYKLEAIDGYAYKWVRYSSDISPSSSALYRVIFTATLNASRSEFVQPYIAIDDISFTPQCTISTGPVVVPTLPDHSTVTTPKNNCPTLSCISPTGRTVCLTASDLCDFYRDCKDWSDEQNCGNCTFDSGTMCQWTNYATRNPWTVVKPAYTSAGTLPKRDASSSSYGGYLTIKMITSMISLTPMSRLQSPQLNGRTASTCKLQFSYYSGQGGYLTVRRYRSGYITELFSTRASTPASQWQSYQVDIGANLGGFNLEFYGSSTHHFGFFEDLAIDNVQLLYCNPHIHYPTPPPSAGSLNCSFEDGLCGWMVTGPTQRSNWLRTSSYYKEPGNDADSLKYPKPSRYGTWMTTQSLSNSFMPDKDYLISSVKLASSTTYCFSFWVYFMSIDRYSFFALYASKTGKASSTPDTDLDYTALWRTELPLRNWNKKYVEISPQSNPFYLLFIAAVDQSGIVGLDSTELVPGKCPIVSNEFCDFEINNCDWTLQSNGFQRNPNSVKFRDHTTDTTSGHFIQDTSTGSTAVMTKQLASLPIFNNSNSNIRRQSFCLQFYYYMATDFVDSTMEDSTSWISVKVKQGIYTQYRNFSILDTYNVGQLQTWALFQMSFYGLKTGSIEIDALQAKSMTQLLIDDISVSQRFCQLFGACDFEVDMCGWSNLQPRGERKKILWLRIQPNSRYIKGNLLHYDHTTQGNRGNYLVMPAMMQANAFSVLRSPLLSMNTYTHACFSMYYFAKGANSSVKALTLQLIDIGKRTSTTYSINASYYLEWRKAEFEFAKVPTKFFIQISGTYTNGIYSDIGIDDINITPGRCSGRNLPTTTTAVPPREKMLDCNFDSGSCNWKYDQSEWKAGRFSAMKNIYAPYLDHTLQTSSGQYLLFQSANVRPQVYYTISSTLNITYDKDHCLSVWYFEDGEDIFTVNMYMVLPQFNVVANRFTSAIENRRRWNLLKADIQYNPGYNFKSIGLQIRFAPNPNSLKQFSIFALDDIKVRPGKCQHQHDYVYTMASGIEDLELEYIQPLVGAIGQVYTPVYDPQPGAPAVDHTTETKLGSYFLFMNRYTRAPTAYIATLSMMDIPKDSSFSSFTCVRFAYQVNGNATLKVYVAPNDAFSYFYRYSSPIWQSRYSKNVWTIGEINIRALYEHKVVFYMEKQPDKTSFIALDDLSLLSHRCQSPIDCDFDNGRICSYSPLMDKTTSLFNWGLFTSPPQDSSWPGPTIDHTRTSDYGGGYLYLTAYRSVGTFSSPIIAKVVSGPRTVVPTKSYCLSLWMLMSTNDLSLKLSLLRYGPYWTDSNRTTTIASKANTAETAWTRVSIPIDQTMLMNTFEIQLIIEGTIAVNSKGGIFIDDILLMEGACTQTNLFCEDGTPYKPEQICNFVKDCKSGLDELNCGTSLCNFETNSCGWGNMSTFNQRWLLTGASQALVLNRNAPDIDGNANKSGHYLMVSSSSFGTYSNAEVALNFPNPGMYLKNSYQTCVMQFDYYISAPKMNGYSYSLAVRIGRDRTDWSTVYYIAQAWSLNGWSKAYAHIGERNSQFMADLLGHLDNSRTSAMAVDNIQFVNCSMPAPLGPKQQCSGGQFMCKKYRFCVSNDAICNYKNDCGDGSDEIDCYRWTRCNFESFASCHIKTDYMEAHHSLGINVRWNIHHGSTSDPYDPQIDNTLRTGRGHYLALKTLLSGSNLKQTFTSEFYSPMMTSLNGNACRMRFFYFINGEPVTISATHLDIYIRYANKNTAEPSSILNLRLNIKGDLQQRWNFAATQFTSTQPFQFVFRGVLGTNRSRIAVDDISFDPSGCQTSSISPVTPTTGQPVTGNTGGNSGNPTTLTPSPGVNRQRPRSNSGKVAAGILIPLFLVLGAISAYFAYRKYRNRPRGDEHITLSMKNIQEDTDY